MSSSNLEPVTAVVNPPNVPQPDYTELLLQLLATTSGQQAFKDAQWSLTDENKDLANEILTSSSETS